MQVAEQSPRNREAIRISLQGVNRLLATANTAFQLAALPILVARTFFSMFADPFRKSTVAYAGVLKARR